MRRLGARLRELREAAGLTQEEVAARTGKDRSTLYRLESAQQRPQRSTLIQLLNAPSTNQICPKSTQTPGTGTGG